jgi:hypothetical protein
MVQIQRFDVRDRIILTPAIRRPVRTTHEQAVQNGEKHGALHRELVAARCGEIARQPVSSCSRSNTGAGPIRRTAIFVASSDAALSTAALATNRAPERSNHSTCLELVHTH